MYEGHKTSAATREALLAQLNEQGARGYRLYEYVNSWLGLPDASNTLFVKDVATTYAYESQELATTTEALQARLAAQGARGFRWLRPRYIDGVVYDLFRKDLGASTTYSYTLMPAQRYVAAAIDQANSMGATGHYAVGDLEAPLAVDQNPVQIYEKASSGGTYAYERLPTVSRDAEFLAQLNAQGARGFNWRGRNDFGDANVNVYVKDTTQSATFAYHALPHCAMSFSCKGNGDLSDLVEQANAEGQKHAGLVTTGILIESMQSVNLYFTPDKCAGFLCQVSGSLTISR